MHERFKSLGHQVCYCLCSKGMLVGVEPDPTVPPANDESYWCVMTQTVIGPDGKVVTPEECRPGRSCYYQLD